ncbi:uncharacterized protein [Dermacentor andersoni]|uniref:uncharacterized protein isoform X1 n=1 Tax=Dermacentor andersoni TaxID=34620 RepID=UPI002155F2CF|nr:uncharacterized protein LOC126522043 isoform X1 [Dermacentor andersoni]
MATAKEPPKMDDLLQKLRRSIAELSLQGDDFTRQMWHMYNTFEDVVVGGTLPSTDHPAGDAQQQHTLPPSQQPPPAAADDTAAPAAVAAGSLRGGDVAAATAGAQATAAPRAPKPVRIPSSPDVRRDSSSPTASPGARRKKRPMSQRCSYAACGSSGSSISSSSSGSQQQPQQRSSLSSSGNPLLDTIGSMTYDPCCESDDYYDLASVYLQRRQARQHSDGESIAYAGSIDSGYKSLCPTPEIPDYEAEAKPPGKAVVVPPQPAAVVAATARLAAPATAGGQQGHKPTQEELDADLDHLMQLRQSLLTAIARCESPVSPKSSTGSPRAGSAGDKTVRFSTEKLTSAPSCSPAKAPGTRAKPILKDPLCANLRANLERPDSGGTLEEEIDSLLCGGKPDYYDLDARFPPSTYVTMVEEKYRSNAGYSVAKVKCLKDKCQESSKDHNHATLTAEPSRRSQSHARQSHQQPQHHQAGPLTPALGTYNPPISAEPMVSRSEKSTAHPVPTPRCSAAHVATTANSAKPGSPKPTLMRSAKSRFNEVAKCMLEIIEDLQHKKITEPRPAKTSSSKLPAATATAASSSSQPLRDTHIGGSRAGPISVHQQQQQQTQRPLSDSEYHVYEEVLYDFVNSAGSVASELQRPPPPLPARPSEPGHRPKQRSNLYSLVRNQEERRNISKSLEQEWSGDRSTRLEDEYGFRSVTNS